MDMVVLDKEMSETKSPKNQLNSLAMLKSKLKNDIELSRRRMKELERVTDKLFPGKSTGMLISISNTPPSSPSPKQALSHPMTNTTVCIIPNIFIDQRVTQFQLIIILVCCFWFRHRHQQFKICQ